MVTPKRSKPGCSNIHCCRPSCSAQVANCAAMYNTSVPLSPAHAVAAATPLQPRYCVAAMASGGKRDTR